MTEQERLRKSLRFWLMHKLWVKAGDVSRWAGRRIVAWSRAADERDCLKSAGILCYRRIKGFIEVLLVHPGGPFWKDKDFNSWGIPKGEVESNDLFPLGDAIREFKEETAFDAPSKLDYIGEFRVNTHKKVKVWAGEKDQDLSKFESNTCEIEYQGSIITIPEVDKCEWFDLKTTREKMIPGQKQILSGFEKSMEGK